MTTPVPHTELSVSPISGPRKSLLQAYAEATAAAATTQTPQTVIAWIDHNMLWFEYLSTASHVANVEGRTYRKNTTVALVTIKPDGSATYHHAEPDVTKLLREGV